MGFFKKKPGGTGLGNLLRGIVNSKLGLNLQPPIPLPTPSASTIPDTSTFVKEPDKIKNQNPLGAVGDILNNIKSGVENATKVPKKANSLMTVGIIALIVIAGSSLMRGRRR